MSEITVESQEVLSRKKSKKDKDLRRTYKRLRLAAIILAVIVVAAVAMFIARMDSTGMDSYYENQLDAAERVISGTNNPKALSAAYAKIGYIYFKVKRFPQADINFKKALSYTPKSAVVLYWLGRTSDSSGSANEAIKYYTKAGENARKSGKYLPYYELGTIYQRQKKYDKAIEFYKKSVADHNQIWNTYLKLGQVYEKTNQKNLAIENYKLALKFYPDSKEANAGVKRLTTGTK